MAIVGAGFTGLWLAYELTKAEPALDVVVLEAETAGFGASGRNGGWVVGSLAGDRDLWKQRAGTEGVRSLTHAARAAVDEIGEVVRREEIECGFLKSGALSVAQNAAQMKRLESRVESERLWDADHEGGRLLDADQTMSRVAVRQAVGGHFNPDCARVQPARLARGLADVAERNGATIYEDSRVVDIRPGLVTTERGQVRARYAIRATEAYTSRLPGARRTLVPVNSVMLATEPLSESHWRDLRWDGRETLATQEHLFVYSQRTADDRIAIGGATGVNYRFGSRTDAEVAPSKRAVEKLRLRLLDLFPSLGSVGIESGWSGVLGVPRNWSPAIGIDRSTGLGWAGGYVGEGVAASNLAARTLRDLILERETELTTLPWVGPFSRDWEPEPIRYAGVQGVHGLLGLADQIERRSGRTSVLGSVANLLAGR